MVGYGLINDGKDKKWGDYHQIKPPTARHSVYLSRPQIFIS